MKQKKFLINKEYDLIHKKIIQIFFFIGIFLNNVTNSDTISPMINKK